jgi:hypothetical protein
MVGRSPCPLHDHSRADLAKLRPDAGLRLPTLAEMARIKAWLLAIRFTVRDYLDTVVLFPGGSAAAGRRRAVGCAAGSQGAFAKPLKGFIQKKSKHGIATPRVDLDLIERRLKRAREDYDQWSRSANLRSR